MKNSFRVFLSVYIGCSVSFLLSFAGGEKGLQALNSLTEYEREVRSNIASLKKQNAALTRDLNLLTKSEQNLILQTRVLGYHTAQEGIIRVAGVGHRSRQLEIGGITSRNLVEPNDAWFPRLLGLCSGIMFFLLSWVVHKLVS